MSVSDLYSSISEVNTIFQKHNISLSGFHDARCPADRSVGHCTCFQTQRTWQKQGVETSNEISCGAKICPIVLGFTSLANKVCLSSDSSNLSICGFPILFQLPPIAGRQLEKVPSFLSWTSGPPTWKIGRSVFLLCFSLAWAFTLNLRTGLAANDCLVHDANPASSSHKTWKGHCKGLFYILQLQHISFQEGRGTWRKSP